MDLQRLTTLGNSLNFIDTNNISYDDKRCYGIIKAIVFHRTHQNSKLNNKNSKIINPMYFNLTFKNEIYDKINISSIFKSKCVIKLIPKTFSNFSPTLSYSLVNSVRSKLVNYKQTINEFANNPILPTCNCHNNSNYIYQPSGHVITGDLNFINNKNLN